ncbi:MarR family winged helix-turn-helix transcriptional regulator [Humitalea sp. 24SJ18S-53]|uniref:MarR family winged helix-turn-helix transcriptional regulator n=1 Tax=Humitalea sp. 24SJ18S-53 TaxID=3422307 RepID=UPI003D66B847
MPETISDVCTCLAIRRAARHISSYYDRHLAPSGLLTSQFSILGRLRQRGGCTIQDLAADLVMDRTTLGRNLGPLERDGLVAIAADPADRRRRLLHVTDAGLERLAVARPLWQAAQQGFADAFGEAPARDLRDRLASLVATELPHP